MGIAWSIAVFDPVAQRDRLICESRATLTRRLLASLYAFRSMFLIGHSTSFSGRCTNWELSEDSGHPGDVRGRSIRRKWTP